ncbi:MAG: signal peptide peptidase SppA [Deltaproteobacteria bacterium]|nr:signal peptide peptidase SppA [Deltaproteobacteria bacterium]
MDYFGAIFHYYRMCCCTDSFISSYTAIGGAGAGRRGGDQDSSVEYIRNHLREERVKRLGIFKKGFPGGVIIKINSPGGSVTATDIIYHELMQYKKQTGVRIVACLTSTATSGGYYVASVADEIIAHPTSVTGNIGVIAMKFNVEKFLSKIGIQEETIKSGEKKDIWSPFRPSTPEEKDIIQTIINTLHERFVKVVFAGRQPLLSKEEIRKLADGRIFTADQALEMKLIDRIGYLDDAVEEMKKALKLEDAKIVTYNRPRSYKGTIYSGLPVTSHKEINLIAINGDGLAAISGLQFMYLWRP